MYLKPTKTTLPYITYKKNGQERNASFCCKADCMYVSKSISFCSLFPFISSISSQTDGLPYAVRCSFLSFFHSYFFFLLFNFWGSLGSVFVRSYPSLMMLNFSGVIIDEVRVGRDPCR